jgi:hypothetical protein
MISWRRVIGFGAVVVLIAVGCSQRQDSSSSGTMGGSQTGTAVDTSAGRGSGSHGTAMDTTEALSGLAAARVHEAALRSDIENGRLKEVRHHIEALQAALVRVGEEATGLSANQRTVLGQLLTDEAAIAEDVRDASGAGELDRAKKEFARLRLALRAIESQLGAAAH